MESAVRGAGTVALFELAMLLGPGICRDKGLGLGGCAKATQRQWRMVKVRMIAVMAESGSLVRC